MQAWEAAVALDLAGAQHEARLLGDDHLGRAAEIERAAAEVGYAALQLVRFLEAGWEVRGAQSATRAWDVVIFDPGGTLDRIPGQIVKMPDHALGSNFGVLAEKFEGVDAGRRIVFLVGELG